MPGSLIRAWARSQAQFAEEVRLVGTDTGLATTGFAADDMLITVADLHLLMANTNGSLIEQIPDSGTSPAAEQMMAVAVRFPLGAVLGKTVRRRRRQRAAGSASPGPRGELCG